MGVEATQTAAGTVAGESVQCARTFDGDRWQAKARRF